MIGETDLSILLKEMRPKLSKSAYIFCSLSPEAFSHLSVSPLMVFHEKEGLTVVVTQEQAREHGLPFDETWAWIELTVHSSLSAVGLIAAVSRKLAHAGIGLNVLSAF